ncbi:MAG: hypothetical protein WAW11_00925 [Patescibacteria group bacterium]
MIKSIKIIKEDQSSGWQNFFDLVKEHPGMHFNFQPASDEFPEFYGDQKYEIMLYSGKTCMAIVDDSNEEKLTWRKSTGYNVVDGQVVAWKVINESEEERIIPKDPFLFLDGLQQQAEKTQQHVKDLAAEAEMDVRFFKMSGETLLFQEIFPDFIKGFRYQPVVPQPHYLISGLEIIAKPWHNNAFDKDIRCSIGVMIKLLIWHDRDAESVTFDDNPQEYWNFHVGSLGLSEGKYKGERFGVITNLLEEKNGSWDSKIAIPDFLDYSRLRDALKRGFETIGIPFPKIEKIA